MRIIKNRVGEKHGRLSVVAFSHHIGSKAYWGCACECGNNIVVRGDHMASGRIRSCGCISEEVKRNRLKTHGEAKLTKEYKAWARMKERCSNKNMTGYEYWGGRGIKVYPEWIKSYQSFLDYVGRAPSHLHSIDRINNDGNYEPGNVRWATRSEQNNNKGQYNRKNKIICNTSV